MSTSTALRPASLVRSHERPPQVEADGVRTWIARGANFVVAVSRVQAGARLTRDDQPDEYIVVLPDAPATIRAGGQTLQAEAESLTIVPPGRSEIVAGADGQIVCVYSNRAADLLALADNADAYAQPTPEVAPLVPWPTPADGFRLRHYKLADYTKPDSNMRIFRSTNLMVNVMLPRPAPRDVRKLSPHSHADFEQGSLAVRGRWQHHLRYPWTPDRTQWREDEHVEADSPSLLVVPPKVIHTSHNVNEGGSWLFDIFAPPRLDFSSKPGMVANADDYPMPD